MKYFQLIVRYLLMSVIFTSNSYAHSLMKTSIITRPCRINIENVKISPDGQHLAIICNDDYINHQNVYKLAIFDTSNMRELSRVEFLKESAFKSAIFSPEFSLDGQSVIIPTSKNKQINLTTIGVTAPYHVTDTPLFLADKIFTGLVRSQHIASDGTIYLGIAIYGKGANLFAVDPSNNDVSEVFFEQANTTRGENIMDIISEGNLVFTISDDNILRTHDINQLMHENKIATSKLGVNYSLTLKGQKLYLGSTDTLSIFDVNNGQKIEQTSYATNRHNYIIPRPQSDVFLTLTDTPSIQLRHMIDKKVIIDTANLPEYQGLFLPPRPSIDLSQDASILAVTDKDNIILSQITYP